MKKVVVMYSYIVEGGVRLKGEVDISGSKNASLPIIAASIWYAAMDLLMVFYSD